MSSRAQTHTGAIVWLMIFAFWLAILFLDGAFSSSSSASPLPISDASLTASLTESSTSLGVSSGDNAEPITQVQAMVSDTIRQQLWNSEIFKDLNVLEYLYEKNKNADLLQPMVEKFLQYYQFDKANAYLTLLVTEEGGYFKLKIDPRQVLYTRFHDSRLGLDSANSLDDIFVLAKEYRSLNLLTVDDELFYKGLRALRVYDYASATESFSQITDARYKDFKASYESALANYTKIKNPPAYYRDGLVALTLLKNWYFSFAKRLALHAVAQNQTYILPYQVLAYTNFLMHNRESAKDYFLRLADFDAHNAFLYKFLIGICYYRYGDYEQALIFLNQVTDPSLQIDVYRYMLLSYIQIEDTTNMLRMRHNLLGQSDLQSSDFALFFDQMFFIPFRSGKPFSLYSDNTQLVDLYLGKCSILFSGSQVDVCTYGEVGLQLAQQNLSSIGTKLLSLTEKYHQSHLYHLLGDYYLSLKQIALAKESYIKALSICDDLAEQSIIKSKIEQTSK